jgi:hypothetical protein
MIGTQEPQRSKYPTVPGFISPAESFFEHHIAVGFVFETSMICKMYLDASRPHALKLNCFLVDRSANSDLVLVCQHREVSLSE